MVGQGKETLRGPGEAVRACRLFIHMLLYCLEFFSGRAS